MNLPRNVHKKIEIYLSDLQIHLRTLNKEEVYDIIEELRSHIIDKITVSEETILSQVENILASLGDPQDLAHQYLNNDFNGQNKIELSHKFYKNYESSKLINKVFSLGSFFGGYCLGITFILLAFLKLLHPQTAGLWVIPDGSDDFIISLRFGFNPIPLGGNEILGWWSFPLWLLIGAIFLMMTKHFTHTKLSFRQSKLT